MKKKQQQEAGAPLWVLTYGDCMSLLLCFFIVLFSMSEIKQEDRFFKVLESLRAAFGGYEGAVGALPIHNEPANALLQRLLELDLPRSTDKQGDTEYEGIEGRKWRVTNVRNGIQVVVGGRITFDRFSATLKSEAQELIAGAADILRGYNTRVLIRGHATREALPTDSIYTDATDLSFARARAVAAELVRHGVREERLVLIAVGDHEPLVRQAYTEERRAENRRVEIIVTEDLMEDYAGSGLHEQTEESSHGG
ncbi:MAG TPA: flagellar motor protein MotB [Phycisphaerae bacterium]|nr:flagellar motor protein MotB [Phycisphaerae bacterium]HNU46164.1 flagellar motor protein MotB [Phycisphaerae bacterium]